MDKIVESMIENKIIKEEDRELYAFGLMQGAVLLFNIITTIVIGAVFHMVWQSFLFMIAYMPLRVYAGGYHAKTQLRCYLFSVVMVIVVLSSISYAVLWEIIALAIAGIAVSLVFMLAPVANENKPLDKLEIIEYKGRARQIVTVESCIFIILLTWGRSEAAFCIAAAIIVECVMLILGTLQNRINKKKALQ